MDPVLAFIIVLLMILIIFSIFVGIMVIKTYIDTEIKSVASKGRYPRKFTKKK